MLQSQDVQNMAGNAHHYSRRRHGETLPKVDTNTDTELGMSE